MVAAIASCGPIEYLNQVGSRAASAIAAARRAQAERYAPFEYTAAQEYLHKAREEAGYSQYETSIEYGRRAEELANRAIAIAATSQAAAAAAPATPAAPAEAATQTAPAGPSSSALPEGVDNEEPGQASKKPAPAAAPAPRKRRGTE